MKGQFVFEFLIAGLIFFAIVVYTINYLNVNVLDFKGKFYQSWLQGKSVQISEVLMKSGSSLGLVDDSGFSLTRIQEFNDTYCDLSMKGYRNLTRDLYEEAIYGVRNDVKIHLSNSSDTLLNCGPRIPGSPRAEMERIGTLGGEIAKLRVIVW